MASFSPLHLLLLLFCLLRVTRGDEGTCECSLFLSEGDSWVQEITPIAPPTPISSCISAYITCMRECLQQFSEWHGDLSHAVTPSVTVGELLCRRLAALGMPHVPPSMVHLYMSICGGPWQYSEVGVRQPLCCSAGAHVSCTPSGGHGGAGAGLGRRMGAGPSQVIHRDAAPATSFFASSAQVPPSVPTSSHSMPRSMAM